MEADVYVEVMGKLIGEIKPKGASHLDKDRTENLKVFLKVWYDMHTQIDDIIYYNEDRQESSIVHMVKLCNEALDKSGVRRY